MIRLNPRFRRLFFSFHLKCCWNQCQTISGVGRTWLICSGGTTILLFFLFIYSINYDNSLPASPLQLLSVHSIWRTCCREQDHQRDICGVNKCLGPCPARQQQFNITDGDNTNTSDDEDRAFFLETTGFGELDDRQACAVESLARLNPNLAVYLVSFEASNSTIDSSRIGLLTTAYGNVRHVRIADLDAFVVGTPLDHWFFCSDWRLSPHAVAHLSDGLRLLMLSLYGGYYFDLELGH